MNKLFAHVVTLPRWFALPAAASAIVLGCVMSGASGLTTVLAVLAGAFVMAWAHTMNTWLDYYWTGLDRGAEGERSRKKEYTGGQQPIADGVLSGREVLANALLWLAASGLLVGLIGCRGSGWIWLPWALTVLCTFWYSWAKTKWHPEIALGAGFATFATWFGMAAGGEIQWGLGFLASLPLFVMWGGLAEHVDQWLDWEPNWPKGARSLGMLVGKLGVPLHWSIAWGFGLAYMVQAWLVAADIVSSWTGLAFIAAIPATVCAILIDKEQKAGVLWGLAAILAHMVLFVAGQAIGG